MSLFCAFLVGAGLFLGLYFVGDSDMAYRRTIDAVPPNTARSGAAYEPYTPAAAIPAPVSRY